VLVGGGGGGLGGDGGEGVGSRCGGGGEMLNRWGGLAYRTFSELVERRKEWGRFTAMYDGHVCNYR
jgi:hypothetical protein